MNVEPFTVDRVTMPNIQRKPVRSLGRMIDHTLSDKEQKEALEEGIEDAIKKLDKSDLAGTMKVWGYQFMLLATVSWKLMIYELPMSWVEGMERKINKWLRKWLGISKNITDVALFCPETPCPLPLRSLVKEFKKTKVNASIQLRQSQDEEVAKNYQLGSSKK